MRRIARVGALLALALTGCPDGGVEATAAFISFTPSTLPNGAAGVAYAQSLTPSGGVAPYAWSVTSGTMPAGLAFDPATATVSGTPLAGGTTGTFTVRLTDSQPVRGSFERTYTLTIPALPGLAFTPAALPDGAVAVAYSQTFTPSGGLAPYAWALTAGSLPPGLGFNAGTVSGTPTSGGSSGTFTIRLTDAQIPAAFFDRDYTVSVPPIPPPAIAPASLPDGAVAVAYSLTLTPSGGLAPYTWSLTAGAVPAGLSFNAGAITGTPTSSGLSTFTVRLTDAQVPAVFTERVFTIDVPPPPPLALAPATLPDGALNIPYGKTLIPSGGLPPYAWALQAGTLPAGLIFDTASGRISGTPTSAPDSGTFTIRLSDTQAPPDSLDRVYTIQVTAFPPVAIMASSQYTAVQNRTFSKALSVAGGVAPYAWTLAGGSPPAGLSLSPAGVISGTPTTLGGPVAFQVQAVDSQVPAVSSIKTISITVTAPVTRFAYVLNMQSATLSIYAVDATTGALRPQGFHGPMDQSSDVELSPDGRFLYVSSTGNNRLISYAVNQEDGRLTQVDLTDVANTPLGMAQHPAGTFFFTPNYFAGVISSIPVNPATGDLGVPVTTPLADPRAVLVSPSGQRLYALRDTGELRVYSIDPGTGALTSEATVATGVVPNAMALSPGGEHLYVAHGSTGGLRTYGVTAGTEVPVFLNVLGGSSQPHAVRVHPAGIAVYVADGPGDSVRVYARNPASGLLTFSASVPAGDAPNDLVVDPSGSALWTPNLGTNDVSIFTIDGTGALTAQGTVRARLDPIKMALLPGLPASFNPRVAYVSDEAANVVRSYAIDDATGQLIGLGSAATGSGPRSPAIHPRGSHLYTPDFNTTGVSAFSVNAGSGALTSIGAQASVTGTQWMEIDPNGRRAYTVGLGDNQIRTYSLDAGTGALASAGATAGGNDLYRALVEPTGQFLYVPRFNNSTVRAFRLDYFTGLPAGGTAFSAETGPIGAAAHPSGRFLYVSNRGSQTVTTHAIAVDTGDLTSPLQSIAAAPQPGPVAVDPKGRFLYVTNETGSSVRGFTIAPATGLLTSIGATACGAKPVGLDVDPSGRFLYVACATAATIDIFSIHPVSGALTPVDSVAGGTSPAWVRILGSLD